MNIFKSDMEGDFRSHLAALENLAELIRPVAEPRDLASLDDIKKHFQLKTTDFFRSDRKLNIGVIGQVKAGKSSFLNSLLFDGQTVLPKASTPKTATLTKIEYSDINKISVEYCSLDEWQVVEQNAAVDLEEEIYRSSRELLKMAAAARINIPELLSKGREDIEFGSYEALVGQLNDFVGENGRFTAFVKSVTLFLDRPELKEISIVDTPGLNDPIVSRTLRTKEFIELCDIVFFLSQAGSFLDMSDWTLLSTQLSQKGVKKLVLIASKYDSAIRDVLRHPSAGDDIFDEPVNNLNEADNIPEAKRITAQKLSSRAKKQVTKFVEDLKKRGSGQELINVISNCVNPLLMSSMCYNMSNKSVDEYDKEEKNIYSALAEFSQDVEKDIALIGDFSQVKGEYDTAVLEKEALLTKKAETFIPTSIEEVKGFLRDAKEREVKRLAILQNSEIHEISSKKREIEQQINNVKSEIVSVIGETVVALESKKSATILELRGLSSEYSHIDTRTGTKTVTTSYKVSDSKWYKPWTWGSSHTEHSYHNESYAYLDVSDAADNIHKYSNDVVSQLESIFSETANISAMKRRLLGVIVNNFDTSSQNYDAGFFRLLTEKSLNEIEFPIIKLDFSGQQSRITTKFSGEVTSSADKTNLNQMLSNAITEIFDQVALSVGTEVARFKSQLDSIANKLSQTLLENIESEFEEINAQFHDKELQIQRISTYIKSLEQAAERL